MSRGTKRPLSYRDALELLGAKDSGAAALLGRLAGVGIAAADVATAGALTFFDLRDEIVSWGNSLTSSLRERLSGISRLDRTERITAAHAVLVITSFYEALDEHGMAELAAIATLPSSQRQFFKMLTELGLPMPSPTVAFEKVERELFNFYKVLEVSLINDFSDPEVPEPNMSTNPITDTAIRHYAMAYRSLATEVPEFAIWAGMVDAQATRSAVNFLGDDLRHRIDGLDTALAGVRELLIAVGTGSIPDSYRAELAIAYRSHLSRPILDSQKAPDGVTLPTLATAYINPACRISIQPSDDPIASENWWSSATVVSDIQMFLAGHLTSAQATRSPLVILGQPGSGKSLLTRMLAASLPESDFLPIRVELRAVPADAHVQDQIAEAVYQTINRKLDWPNLVASAHGALPVVMLDGFDELIQATGVNHADYLEQARNFQVQQAELGRPVAIIVTTRTAVVDRARFPADSIAVRLEPFDETRVRRWLEVWSRVNAGPFAERGLLPLSPEAALAQGELATEPLLLLMLALYDAGTNALQREGSALGRADLYERLLTDFAQREVRKHHPEHPAADERRAVERELRQLSIAALAMFNRGRQSVSERELDEDLALLGITSQPGQQDTGGTIRRTLTAAETIVGRFFFIHEPTARRDVGAPERSFEFLHATFGEFLVARLIVNTVLELVNDRDYQASRPAPAPLDAGLLHAATSFHFLSGRKPIVEFCAGLFEMQDRPKRESCRTLMVELLRDSLFAHPNWRHADYQPERLTVPARYAAFSANLMILAVFAEGTALDTADLLLDECFDWDSLRTLWRSRVDECFTLTDVLRARRPDNRGMSNGAPKTEGLHILINNFSVEPEDGSPALFSDTPCLILEVAEHTIRLGESIFEYQTTSDSSAGIALRKSAMFDIETQIDSFVPYWRHIGESTRYVSDGGVVVPLHTLLLDIALAPEAETAPQQLAKKYLILLRGSEPKMYPAMLKLLRNDVRSLTAEDALKIILEVDSLAYPTYEIWQSLCEITAEYALEHDPALSANLVAHVIDLAQQKGPVMGATLQAAFERVGLPYPPTMPTQRTSSPQGHP